MLVLVLAITAIVLGTPDTLLVMLLAGTVLTVTVARCKLTDDERLVHPISYRVAAAVILAIALFGGGVGLVPNASDDSQLVGVYFAIVSVVVCRALVARGPHRAVLAIVIAMWTWIPVVFVSRIGCKWPRHPHEPHWSEIATLLSLRAVLLLLPVLATATLFAFELRRAPRSA